MCLENNIELELASLELKDSMLKPIAFDDDDDPLQMSSSMPKNVEFGLDIEEEQDGGEHSGSGSDLDYSNMNDDHLGAIKFFHL